MNQKELAEALGVDPALVSRDARRGMPVDSVEAARAWRRHNVAPYVRSRGGSQPAPATADAPAGRLADDLDELPERLKAVAMLPRADARAVAEALGAAAAARLRDGLDIEALVPALRAALRALLPDHADPLPYAPCVMEVLIAPVLARVERAFSNDEEREAERRAARNMTAEEAARMGRFWTVVAAGLFKLPAP